MNDFHEDIFVLRRQRVQSSLVKVHVLAGELNEIVRHVRVVHGSLCQIVSPLGRAEC